MNENINTGEFVKFAIKQTAKTALTVAGVYLLGYGLIKVSYHMGRVEMVHEIVQAAPKETTDEVFKLLSKVINS